MTLACPLNPSVPPSMIGLMVSSDGAPSSSNSEWEGWECGQIMVKQWSKNNNMQRNGLRGGRGLVYRDQPPPPKQLMSVDIVTHEEHDLHSAAVCDLHSAAVCCAHAPRRPQTSEFM